MSGAEMMIVKKWLGVFLVLAGLSAMGAQVLAAEVLWIDVRSVSEYRDGHLAQAVNVPYKEIDERIGEYAPAKDTVIKLYCGSGRRAGIALDALEAMGYTNVSNEGGYKNLVKKEMQ